MSSVITCVHCPSCSVIALLGFSGNGSSPPSRPLNKRSVYLCVGGGRGKDEGMGSYFVFVFVFSFFNLLPLFEVGMSVANLN